MAIKRQVIEFRCDETGKDARLIVNGVDMSSDVAEVRIEAAAGKLTKVWFRYAVPTVTTELVAYEWVRLAAAPAPDQEEGAA